MSIAGQNVSISGDTGGGFGTLTGGTITVGDGNLTFTGGNTHLDDDISVNGGTGSVTNQGVLQVATSHLIAGSFIQTSAGVLDIQAAGTGTGEYGSLTSTGAATFAGGLAFDLVNGFTLATGNDFNIFNFASSTGDFSTFSLNGASRLGARRGQMGLRRLGFHRGLHQHLAEPRFPPMCRSRRRSGCSVRPWPRWQRCAAAAPAGTPEAARRPSVAWPGGTARPCCVLPLVSWPDFIQPSTPCGAGRGKPPAADKRHRPTPSSADPQPRTKTMAAFDRTTSIPTILNG